MAEGWESGDNPKVVLLGPSGTGKTSLLGALAHALPNSGSEKLRDMGQEFAAAKIAPTKSAGQPLPITLDAKDKTGPLSALVMDTAGGEAAQILDQPELLEKRPRGSMCQALQGADALVLTADASVDGPRLQSELAQLASFLKHYEETRARRASVAGLPVFLALTKCDLLAGKSGGETWHKKVEERQKQIAADFARLFAGEHAPAFGTIDVHVEATAAPPAGQPQGVVQLFRDCCRAANDYRRRCARSNQRLKAALAGVLALVLLMAISGAVVFVSRPAAEVVALENSLLGLLPPDQARPADRLREPLEDKLQQLRKIRKNPHFSELPAATRSAVDRYVEEIEAYLKYNVDFLVAVRDPRFAGSEEDLLRIEKNVAALPFPEAHAADWKDSRLARRKHMWLEDVRILRREVPLAETWYKDRVEEGKKLEKEGFRLLGMQATGKEREGWLKQLEQFTARPWPHKPADHPPGGASITYETVYRFDAVRRARRAWDDISQRLDFVKRRLME
jgi:GTPase SAR1 family protein